MSETEVKARKDSEKRSFQRRRELYLDPPLETAAETPASAPDREDGEKDFVELTREEKRARDRAYVPLIDCPMCEETLEGPSQNSVFQSLRCEACGHMFGFDEAMALRAAEHLRASRYF